MRSLLVAPTLPSDSGNGLAMRVGAFLEALSTLGEVDLVVLPIFEAVPSANSFCQRLGITPTIVPVQGRIDTHFALLSRIEDRKVRLESFGEYGKPSLAAFASVPVLEEIRQRVAGRDYELVHIARSYLLPVVDAWPKGQRPMFSADLDEDDAGTQRSIAMLHRRRGDAGAEAWLEAEASAFERLVRKWLPCAELSFISTDNDRQALSRWCAPTGLTVARNAIAIPERPAKTKPGTDLLFVGGFGYFPNLDAASWLLEEIFPLLTVLSPETLSLTIVGRDPPRSLRDRARLPNATILEDVDDLGPVYAQSSIAVVPVRAGGGSRIKVLEAAAYGVPIVSTTFGAEGTQMRDGEELWLADTPQAFVDAVVDVLQSPSEAARRTAAAGAYVEQFHSRDSLISMIAERFAGKIETSLEPYDGVVT